MTPLIGHDTELQRLDGLDLSGKPQDQDSVLWEEMGAPWPATFEQSISLLASLVIKAEKKSLTKSPKPGNTPVGIRRQMIVSHCNLSYCFSPVFLILRRLIFHL